MSAKEFHEKLIELGYPDAEQLDQRSFEWLTEDPSLSQFFKWFINEIDSSNVVTEQEMIMYEKLVASGDILCDDELDIESHILALEDDTGIDLKENVDALKDELSNIKDEFEMLRALQARLMDKAVSSATIVDIKALKEAEDDVLKKCLARCHDINNEVNVSLDELRNVLIVIQNIVKHASNSSHNSHFLSFLPLEDLNSQHVEYSKNLQELFSIFGNDMDGESKVNSLDYSLPNNRLQFDNDVKLLHASLIKVYKQWISTLTQEKCLVAEIHASEMFLQTLKDDGHNQWTRGRISRNISVATECTAISTPIRDVVIPKLIHDIADLHTGTAIISSYDMELKRQSEQISKLDKVVDFVVQQLSVFEFLTGAVSQEYKVFEKIAKLVAHLYDILQYQDYGVKKRKIATQHLAHCVADLEQNQSGCESFLKIIDKIFSSSEKDTVLSVLNDKSEALKSQRESTISKYELESRKLASINTSLKNLREIIWMECSTKWGPPLLTPKIVQEKMEDLGTKIKNAKLALMSISGSYKHKVKILKTNPKLQKQRGLYLEFCKNIAE